MEGGEKPNIISSVDREGWKIHTFRLNCISINFSRMSVNGHRRFNTYNSHTVPAVGGSEGACRCIHGYSVAGRETIICCGEIIDIPATIEQLSTYVHIDDDGDEAGVWVFFCY